MNTFQKGIVGDAMGDMQRAAEKLGMVATQLMAAAEELNGAERSKKVGDALRVYRLGGSGLLALDRYKADIGDPNKAGINHD
jgi:hypothetical protein